MVCREAGAKGTRCGSYRKPREFVWIFRCAIFLCLTRSQSRTEVIAHTLRDVLPVPPLPNDISADEVAIHAPTP